MGRNGRRLIENKYNWEIEEQNYSIYILHYSYEDSLINHYAGSPNLGMEFRPYYVTKGWVKLGHEVLIVGGSYSHLRKVQPQSCEEMIDDVRYRWVKVNPYKGNGIGRIISMFSFVTKLYCNYRRYLRNFKPDIVIASSTYPLDIYPAYRIARHYHANLFMKYMIYGRYPPWS